MADGILARLEELLDECLVDHGDGGAVRVSCGVNPRPITTRVPTESKYSALPLTKEAPLLRSGLPWT